MNASGTTFTAAQWQQLEHQTLVYKYLIYGMPIPPDLLLIVKTSLDSSPSSKLLLQRTQHIGWSSFHMGLGRKFDPEPGRCRRTDGKKWRCSKEAYPDSKYCERHMHRGRNRSRKPVEILSPLPPAADTLITATHSSASSISHLTSHSPSQPKFLYPLCPYSRPPPTAAASTTQFFLDSYPTAEADGFRNRHSSNSYGFGMNGDEARREQPFFSDSISNFETRRGVAGGSAGNTDFSCKPAPLSIGLSLSQMKQNSDDYSDTQSGMKIRCLLNDNISGQQKHGNHHYYNCDTSLINVGRDDQPRKVIHLFLDELAPKDKDSWASLEEQSSSRTQLSIST